MINNIKLIEHYGECQLDGSILNEHWIVRGKRFNRQPTKEEVEAVYMSVPDNEEATGGLRYRIFSIHQENSKILQQQFKCWNSATPQEIVYQWRDVPVVIE